MEFLGKIIEILKFIGPPLCKYIEYHRKLEEYKKHLKRISDELQGQKDGIELRLKAECGFGKLTKPAVHDWLINVQKIFDEEKNIEDTLQKVKCFSCVLRAELVDKKIQEAKEYYEKGTSLSSFNSLVIDAPQPFGITLPTTRLAGETTAKKDMEEIWGHLMGNKIQKIGVCGMGGAGKTTIVTHLNNRLVEENKFNHVIQVTVSQTLDLIKVQNGIANALKKSLSGIEDHKIRAGTLLSMIKGKRFVLILDNVWEAIQLEELGIPEPNEENGCKLVITTRSLDVCRSMGCKTVQVKPLPEKEALELFFEKAELDISTVSSTLQEIVELMVKQCAGLPLAIVIIASSLKGEEDICEWKNALLELSNNERSINDEVFVQLKISYDRLKDERIQRCFLYCALYPEDHDIPKNELVDCWIAEGLVDEIVNLQATKDRSRIIIKSLVNNCLLLESLDNRGRSCVKLHDVVRDMTIRYITSKSPLFMVKAGLKLDELPSEQEWKENLDKVSLMKNRVREIPSSLSPNCQILSTLLLQDNPLESIPESFFSHMHGLKILNLSGTQIESLPNSISELTNLTTLLLQNCGRLKRVPESFFSHIHGLKILNLSGTQIESLPNSISELTNLTTLLLQNCGRLKRVPESFFSHIHGLKILNLSGTQIESLPNSISKLTNLTALLLQNCGSLKHVPSLARLQALAKLELGYTAINEVPAGMEMLANLTSLDLLCSELHMIPAGIFSKLCRLQKLRVNWGLQTRVAVEEAARLKNLDCLLAQFRNLQDFNYYAKSLNGQRGPNEYCLLLSPEDIKDSNQLDLSYWRLYDNDVNKVVILEGCNIYGREEDSIVLPKEVEVLMIGDPLQIIPESFFTHMHGLKILNLSGTQIESLPNSLSELTNLSALLLQNCRRLKRVPESFFSRMHRLKILNLSGTQIESLPNSISELTNLTALLLQNCSRLKDVPSLARLGALEKLELGNTGINEVPTGMEMLANLTSLDLLSEYLNKIPAGIFSKLCHLHKLQVHWGCETLRVAVEEVARLKSLDSFVARFLNLQDFNSYVKYLNSQGRLNEYCLFLKPVVINNDRKSINDWKLNYDVNKAVILNGCNICGGEEDSIILPKEVESLVIIDCGDVRTMRNIPMFNTLERLEILRVENLGNLTGILLNASESSTAGQYQHLKSSPTGQNSHLKVFVGKEWREPLLNASESSPGQYSHLKGVHINECPRLMKLFSSNLLSELKNLEQIEVRNCRAMEELIAVKISPKEFLLPKLKRLSLSDMPKLKSICSGNGSVMVCDSLQVIDIQSCRKLKKILSSSSKLQLGVLKNLEEIDVRDCWEIEEIIAIDDVDCKKELISLPKLRKLTLNDMPKLKSIINVCGSNGVMVCESLQVIDIRSCKKLKKMLSSSSKLQLGVLKNLEEIDVRDCWEIEEIIAIDDVDCKKELISLPKLRKLTLNDMPELKSIINVCGSNGVMVCESLQVIDIRSCKKLKKMLSSSSKLQLGVLKNLEEIDVRDCWEIEEIIAIDDVDCKKELISLPKLRKLTLNEMPKLKSIINVCGSNGVMVCDSLQVIDIQSCKKLKKILPSSKLQLGVRKNLEEIDVRDCWEIEEIIAIDDVDCKKELIISLPKLRKLNLSYLPELKSIINVCGSNGVMVCDSLQVIDIHWCWKLKKILLSSSKLQLGVVKNLEEIKVVFCPEMEEIIAIDDVDCKKELIISLPKLRKLTLRFMRKLKSIINVFGSNGVMVCDSLQEIYIENCPQLKRFPICLPINEKGKPSPPPALIKIKVGRNWWEALEWDHLHPKAQTLLLPFLEFY